MELAERIETNPTQATTSKEMNRYIVAFFIGIAVFCCTATLLFVGVVELNVISPSDIFQAADRGDATVLFGLLEQYLLFAIFLIAPGASFVTGCVSGMIVKRREYATGALTVLPFYVIFFIITVFNLYSLYAFITFGTSVALGAFLAKVLKKRKTNLP